VSDDSHFFGPLRKEVSGKRFRAVADVKQAVTWLQTLSTLHRLPVEQDTNLGATWDKMVNTWSSDGQHAQPTCRVCTEIIIKCSASECLSSSFFVTPGCNREHSNNI
jgi:hypothetical protein